MDSQTIPIPIGTEVGFAKSIPIPICGKTNYLLIIDLHIPLTGSVRRKTICLLYFLAHRAIFCTSELKVREYFFGLFKTMAAYM